MDVLTVREATKFAADYTRSGKVTYQCIVTLLRKHSFEIDQFDH